MKACRWLYLLLTSLLVLGCNQLNLDRQETDRFARAYVNFAKSIYDTDVVGWAILLDQSDNENPTAYRVAFRNSFNFRTTNESRAKAAREALRIHQNRESVLDEFDVRMDVLDKNLLILLESANAISNKEFRQQGIQIGESAKSIKSTVAQLRANLFDSYKNQTDILKRVDAENGNLARILNDMKESVSEMTKLSTAEKDLRNRKESSTQQMREEYAVFKGMTGTTIDYVEPTSPPAPTN